MSPWYLSILPYLKKYGLCGVIIILLITGLWKLYDKNLFLSQENAQLRSEKDEKIVQVNELKSRLGSTGDSIDGYTGSQKNIYDFEKNWDTGEFYMNGEGVYCPKDKKQNYQRMYYLNNTPVTSTNFHLKFQIEDQWKKFVDYTQIIIAGLKFNGNIFSEFHIPTSNSQTVNFRIASESGGLKSGGDGKSISSPIKDKSIIDLVFRTKEKSNEEISQFIDLSYKSKIDEYGNQTQTQTINYDSEINDPNPKTAKANVFIGSYLGGCIKILEWKVN